MEMNELRIGNFVYCVFAGTKCIDIVSYLPSTEEISPIPLTEKWLIKFGFMEVFQVNEEFDNGKAYEISSWGRVGLKNKKLISDEYYFLDGLHAEIKYVHQLQNLYFALTSEELKTKGSTN